MSAIIRPLKVADGEMVEVVKFDGKSVCKEHLNNLGSYGDIIFLCVSNIGVEKVMYPKEIMSVLFPLIREAVPISNECCQMFLKQEDVQTFISLDGVNAESFRFLVKYLVMGITSELTRDLLCVLNPICKMLGVNYLDKLGNNVCMTEDRTNPTTTKDLFSDEMLLEDNSDANNVDMTSLVELETYDKINLCDTHESDSLNLSFSFDHESIGEKSTGDFYPEQERKLSTTTSSIIQVDMVKSAEEVVCKKTVKEFDSPRSRQEAEERTTGLLEGKQFKSVKEVVCQKTIKEFDSPRSRQEAEERTTGLLEDKHSMFMKDNLVTKSTKDFYSSRQEHLSELVERVKSSLQNEKPFEIDDTMDTYLLESSNLDSIFGRESIGEKTTDDFYSVKENTPTDSTKTISVAQKPTDTILSSKECSSRLKEIIFQRTVDNFDPPMVIKDVHNVSLSTPVEDRTSEIKEDNSLFMKDSLGLKSTEDFYPCIPQKLLPLVNSSELIGNETSKLEDMLVGEENEEYLSELNDRSYLDDLLEYEGNEDPIISEQVIAFENAITDSHDEKNNCSASKINPTETETEGVVENISTENTNVSNRSLNVANTENDEYISDSSIKKEIYREVSTAKTDKVLEADIVCAAEGEPMNEEREEINAVETEDMFPTIVKILGTEGNIHEVVTEEIKQSTSIESGGYSSIINITDRNESDKKESDTSVINVVKSTEFNEVDETKSRDVSIPEVVKECSIEDRGISMTKVPEENLKDDEFNLIVKRSDSEENNLESVKDNEVTEVVNTSDIMEDNSPEEIFDEGSNESYRATEDGETVIVNLSEEGNKNEVELKHTVDDFEKVIKSSEACKVTSNVETNVLSIYETYEGNDSIEQSGTAVVNVISSETHAENGFKEDKFMEDEEDPEKRIDAESSNSVSTTKDVESTGFTVSEEEKNKESRNVEVSKAQKGPEDLKSLLVVNVLIESLVVNAPEEKEQNYDQLELSENYFDKENSCKIEGKYENELSKDDTEQGESDNITDIRHTSVQEATSIIPEAMGMPEVQGNYSMESIGSNVMNQIETNHVDASKMQEHNSETQQITNEVWIGKEDDSSDGTIYDEHYETNGAGCSIPISNKTEGLGLLKELDVSDKETVKITPDSEEVSDHNAESIKKEQSNGSTTLEANFQSVEEKENHDEEDYDFNYEKESDEDEICEEDAEQFNQSVQSPLASTSLKPGSSDNYEPSKVNALQIENKVALELKRTKPTEEIENSPKKQKYASVVPDTNDTQVPEVLDSSIKKRPASPMDTQDPNMKKMRKDVDNSLHCALCPTNLQNKTFKVQDLMSHLCSSVHFSKELYNMLPAKDGDPCSICVKEGKKKPVLVTKIKSNYAQHLGKVHGKVIELLPSQFQKQVVMLLKKTSSHWADVVSKLTLSPGVGESPNVLNDEEVLSSEDDVSVAPCTALPLTESSKDNVALGEPSGNQSDSTESSSRKPSPDGTTLTPAPTNLSFKQPTPTSVACKQPTLTNKASKQPTHIISAPKPPISAASKQPTLSSSATDRSTPTSSSFKQISSTSASEQQTPFSSDYKQPTISSPIDPTHTGSASKPTQTSTALKSLVSSIKVSKQPTHTNTALKQPFSSITVSKQSTPTISVSKLQTPTISVSKQQTPTISVSKQPTPSNSASKQSTTSVTGPHQSTTTNEGQPQSNHEVSGSKLHKITEKLANVKSNSGESTTNDVSAVATSAISRHEKAIPVESANTLPTPEKAKPSNNKGSKKKVQLVCDLCKDDKLYNRSTMISHLTKSHFYKNLSASVASSLEPNQSCGLCPISKQSFKYKTKASHIIHLGTVHEKILDFCPTEIMDKFSLYDDI